MGAGRPTSGRLLQQFHNVAILDRRKIFIKLANGPEVFGGFQAHNVVA
jgi:hypothetical protein